MDQLLLSMGSEYLELTEGTLIMSFEQVSHTQDLLTRMYRSFGRDRTEAKLEQLRKMRRLLEL
jgi:hypothetical protein